MSADVVPLARSKMDLAKALRMPHSCDCGFCYEPWEEFEGSWSRVGDFVGCGWLLVREDLTVAPESAHLDTIRSHPDPASVFPWFTAPLTEDIPGDDVYFRRPILECLPTGWTVRWIDAEVGHHNPPVRVAGIVNEAGERVGFVMPLKYRPRAENSDELYATLDDVFGPEGSRS
jgi:hypothetical protein